MAILSDALAYGGTILQLLALFLLVRGPLSRYFPLFLYLVSLLGVSGYLGWVLRAYGVGGKGNDVYFNAFWGAELFNDMMLFFLVISLTLRALEGSIIRDKVVRLLGIVVIATIALPFILFDSAFFGRAWNERTAQLLSFGAAIMTFAMWSALVFSKRRDRQLLTVAAALGVTVTCAALTLGVRHLTDPGSILREMSGWVYRLGQIASPVMWCWAFRPPKPKKTEKKNDSPPSLAPTVSAN